MKLTSKLVAAVVAVALAMPQAAKADALITDFNNFMSDALFASWSALSATIDSGANSYNVTATGYGSNYKYIGFPVINGAGNTHLELAITLSGPAEADGQLGPIVTLIDADGTRNNYAWYGQTLGSHVLTMPLTSPTNVEIVGTTAGLDLTTLTHMHMQLDPGGFTTAPYTLQWENLALVVPEPGSIGLVAAGFGLMALRRRK